MKTNELADIAGVDVSTVRRVAKRLFPDRTIRGKQSEFSEAESVQIMATVKKKNFVERNSALPERKNALLESRLDRLDAKFDKLLDLMIAKESAKKEEPRQITAKLEPKDEIRKIINSYTHHTGTQYRDNWNLLYQECYYRLGKNFRLLAQNRGVKPIDIIIEEGFDMDVLLVSRDLFQLGRA